MQQNVKGEIIMSEEKQELSAEEAAKHLGVSRRTLERYVDLGWIIKYRRRLKRQVYFIKSELDDFKTQTDRVNPEE